MGKKPVNKKNSLRKRRVVFIKSNAPNLKTLEIGYNVYQKVKD